MSSKLVAGAAARRSADGRGDVGPGIIILFTIYNPGPAAGGPDSGHFKDLHKPCEFGYHFPVVCSAAAPAPQGGAPAQRSDGRFSTISRAIMRP